MKFSSTRSFLSLLGILNFIFCFGQTLSENRISVRNGLSTNEVYDLFQDSLGRIWMATSNGISVFNGFTVRNFYSEDKLLNQAVFKISEDPLGRLWFVGLNNIIFYRENELFLPARSSSGDTLKVPGREVLDLYHDSSGLTIQTTTSSYIIRSDGESYRMEPIRTESLGAKLVFSKLSDKRFGVTYRVQKGEIGETVVLDIEDDGSRKRYNIQMKRSVSMSMFVLLQKIRDVYYFSIGNCLYTLKQNGDYTIKEFSGDIIRLRQEKNLLWVYPKQGGIQAFEPEQLETPVFERYPGNTVTDLITDFEGEYVFATLEKGVIFDPVGEKSILHFNRGSAEHIDKIIGNESALFALSKSGKLLRIHQKDRSFEAEYLNPKSLLLEFRTAAVTDSILAICDYSHLSIYGFSGNALNHQYTVNYSFRTMAIAPGDHIYGAHTDSIYHLHKGRAISRTGVPSPAYSLQKIGNNLYIGTNKGLFVQDLTNLQIHKIQIDEIQDNERIQLISQISDHELLLGTKFSGIVYHNLESHESIVFNQEINNLPDNTITGIKILDQDHALISTQLGFSKIHYRMKGVPAENFNITHGLLSDEIHTFGYLRNHIFWGTADGLFGCNLGDLVLNDVPPITSIEKFVNLDDPNDNDFSFAFNKNNFSITLSTSAFRNFQNVAIRYRLRNTDTTYYTVLTQDGSLVLNGLEPGDYSLEIFTANNSGIWTTHPACIDFTIRPPFWRTWWFWSLNLVFLGLLIWFLIRLRIQRVKKREAEKSEALLLIESLKMQALRLQINPHFLFNALNNIQGFYASGNTQLAKNYIHHLSRLLRVILETSQDEVISLENELQVVHHFIELNRLRYSESQEIKISIAPDLDPSSCFVPPFIAQPFIENALLAAFSDKSRKGQVHIRFSRENDLIVIRISDNGKRIDPADFKSNGLLHEISGIQITTRRIEMFNQRNTFYGTSIVIEDSSLEGNCVTIFLKHISDK